MGFKKMHSEKYLINKLCPLCEMIDSNYTHCCSLHSLFSFLRTSFLSESVKNDSRIAFLFAPKTSIKIDNTGEIDMRLCKEMNC